MLWRVQGRCLTFRLNAEPPGVTPIPLSIFQEIMVTNKGYEFYSNNSRSKAFLTYTRVNLKQNNRSDFRKTYRQVTLVLDISKLFEYAIKTNTQHTQTRLSYLLKLPVWLS